MKLLHFLSTLLLALALQGCYYSHPNEPDHWAVTEEGMVDSVNFLISHHYWTGYNFQAVDSLALATLPPMSEEDEYAQLPFDSVKVGAPDKLVVARVVNVPSQGPDSVWVKVARDQLTQGWLPERVLLERVVPDDPISKFIYHFSDSRWLWVLCVAGFVVVGVLLQVFRHKHYRLVHFRDIPSFYPPLLCLCVSGSATLYGSIQRFVPATWVEFYFHPTLNPFSTELPLILALFIASVWTMLIVAVAVVDELRRQPDLGDRLAFLTSLGGVCMVLYLVFTLTTPLYVGYPLLVAYWVFAIRQYLLHQPTHLLCGVCHHAIPGEGRCPNCGAMNLFDPPSHS